MLKKLLLTAMLAVAAIVRPSTAAAQTYNVNAIGESSGSISYKFTFGGITANAFWVDVVNTGTAGTGLLAFALWTNTNPPAASLTNVTFNGASFIHEWSGSVSNWSSDAKKDNFDDIANFDAAAGMRNKDGGVFSGSAPNNSRSWTTTLGTPIRFSFSTVSQLNLTNLKVGFRSDYTSHPGDWSCGFDNAAGTALVNSGDNCTTVLEPPPIVTSTVPEPSTYALMAAGLAGIFAAARRRRRRAAAAFVA